MKIIRRFVNIFAMSCLSILFFQPSIASADCVGFNCLPLIYNAMVTYTQSPIGGTMQYVVQNAMEYEYQQHNPPTTPDYGKMVAANSSNINVMSTLDNLMGTLLNLSTGSLISNSANIGDDPKSSFTQWVNAVSTVPGTDFPNSNANNDSFNLESLIGPVAYQNSLFNPNDNNYNQLSSDQLNAINYIKFLSNMANPTLTAPDYADYLDNKVKKADGSYITTMNDLLTLIPAVKTYRTAYLNWVTTKNIALNNFYHMYAERVKIYGLGHNAILPNSTESGDPNYNASELQVDQYAATRRLTPDWYSKMAVAEPIVIQREILFTLAELRNEEFKRRLEEERITATLSALLPQTTTGAETNLRQLKTAADQAINPQSQIPAAASKYLPPKPQTSEQSNIPPSPPATQPTYGPQ